MKKCHKGDSFHLIRSVAPALFLNSISVSILKKRSNSFRIERKMCRVWIEIESLKTGAGILDLFCFDRGTVSGITIIWPLMLNLHQLTSVTSGNKLKGTKSPYSEKGQALNYVLPLQQNSQTPRSAFFTRVYPLSCSHSP
jgi:hypothetical protein